MIDRVLGLNCETETTAEADQTTGFLLLPSAQPFRVSPSFSPVRLLLLPVICLKMVQFTAFDDSENQHNRQHQRTRAEFEPSDRTPKFLEPSGLDSHLHDGG